VPINIGLAALCICFFYARKDKLGKMAIITARKLFFLRGFDIIDNYVVKYVNIFLMCLTLCAIDSLWGAAFNLIYYVA